MKITSTQARFRADWAVTVLIRAGSVPDRPVQHSRTGAVYQVQRVTLEFTATAVSEAPWTPAALKLTGLTLSSGPLTDIRDSFRVSSVTLAGARLKTDGTPGQQPVTERLWGREEHPDWLRELITTTREQLS